MLPGEERSPPLHGCFTGFLVADITFNEGEVFVLGKAPEVLLEAGAKVIQSHHLIVIPKRFSTKFEPMKPAAPVTRMRFPVTIRSIRSGYRAMDVARVSRITVTFT